MMAEINIDEKLQMSKTKHGNFRSKSKGPSKATTISRHQLVYKMARKAAN